MKNTKKVVKKAVKKVVAKKVVKKAAANPHRIEVKKTTRKGVVSYRYSFELAKKRFNCMQDYKTEKSCLSAAEKLTKKILGA